MAGGGPYPRPLKGHYQLSQSACWETVEQPAGQGRGRWCLLLEGWYMLLDTTGLCRSAMFNNNG